MYILVGMYIHWHVFYWPAHLLTQCQDRCSAKLRQLGLADEAQVRNAFSNPHAATSLAQALRWSPWLTEDRLDRLLSEEEAIDAVRQGVTLRPSVWAVAECLV